MGEGGEGSDGGAREGGDEEVKEGGGHHLWMHIIHGWGVIISHCTPICWWGGHCVHGQSSFFHGGSSLSMGGGGRRCHWVLSFVGAGSCWEL